VQPAIVTQGAVTTIHNADWKDCQLSDGVIKCACSTFYLSLRADGRTTIACPKP